MQKWNFWNPVANFDIDPYNHHMLAHVQVGQAIPLIIIILILTMTQ